jgi:catechol 2,3-dioxygenase-like lactoylglutathione lyase family enzyme
LSFSVTDLERSMRWYGDVLGAVVEAEIQGDGFRRVRLRAPGWGFASR